MQIRKHLLSRPYSRMWLLLAIFLICCGIEAVLQVSDMFSSIPRLRSAAYENAGFWVGLLHHWKPNYAIQPYAMFLTYGFLHAGPVHLAINMITLWSLGRGVVARVGALGFAQLYLGAMIGGGAGYALLANKVNPMIGASGALFGLAGGLLAWAYVDRFTRQETLWPVLQTVALLGLLNAVLWWAMNGQLAWEAHLGGFVAGWVIALLIDPRPEPTEGTPE